ncbi:MAG: AAA family ATPase [Gammaproteobacteria bacterium]|nr:AAA family ATPase [Gammaproteobacteria bacterium]
MAQPRAIPLASASSSSADQKNNLDTDLVEVNVPRDGHCGFHALFGEWNGRYHECKSVVTKRREVAESLKNCHPDAKAIQVAKSAIVDNILGELKVPGDHIGLITTQYQEYLRKNAAEEKIAWDDFELELRRVEPILHMIHCDAKTSPEQLKNNFNKVFLVLDPHGLSASIARVESLRKVFSRWQGLVHGGFNFDRCLANNNDVIIEYADFLQNRDNFLAPHDLAVVAALGNVTVQYYSKSVHVDRDNRIDRVDYSLSDTYNPGCSTQVRVVYDGGAHHFQSLVTIAQRLQMLEQKSSNFNFRFFAAPIFDYKSESSCDPYYGEFEDEIEDNRLKCADCKKLHDSLDDTYEISGENEGKFEPVYHHGKCLRAHLDEKKSYRSGILGKEVDLKYAMRKISAEAQAGLKKSMSAVGYQVQNLKKQQTERRSLFRVCDSLLGYIVLFQNKKSADDVDQKSLEGMRKLRQYKKLGEEPAVLFNNGTIQLRDLSVMHAAKVAAKTGTAVGASFAAAKTGITAVKIFTSAGSSGIGAAVRGVSFSAIRTGITAPMWAGLGTGVAMFALDLWSSNRANNFCRLVREAHEIFESQADRKYDRVLNKIEEAFNVWAITAVMRWFVLSGDDYAYAHYLEACAYLNQRHYDRAYQQFLVSYNDATNLEIKFFCLIQMIKLLQDRKKLGNVKEVVGGADLSDQERKKRHQERITELGSDPFTNIADGYYSTIKNICAGVLSVLGAFPKRFSPGIKQYLEENKQFIVAFLKCDELFLVRYFPGKYNAGKIYEVLLTFLQGLLLYLYHNYGLRQGDLFSVLEEREPRESILSQLGAANSLYDLARDKFLDTWGLIRLFGYAGRAVEISEVSELMSEIKDYIIYFFKQGIETESFAFDAYLMMTERGLLPAADAKISEQEFVEMYRTESNNADCKTAGDILDTIRSRPQLAAEIKFSDGYNLLHILPRIDSSLHLDSKVREAITSLLAARVSPYARDFYGVTPFICIPSADPYRAEQLYAPQQFFGAERQIDAIRSFFNSVIINQNTEQHFLLLVGPPGTGKTQLMRKLALECKYECDDSYSHRNRVWDMFPGMMESDVDSVFNRARAQDQFVCIFMDEIDGEFKEVKGEAEEGRVNWAERVRTLQRQIDRLRGTKVVLVGATNHLEVLDRAIKSRAGDPIMFELPELAARRKIIEHKLRKCRFTKLEFPERFAGATVGASPRDLIQSVDIMLHSAMDAKHPDVLDQQDFEKGVRLYTDLKQSELVATLPGMIVKLPRVMPVSAADAFSNCVGIKPELKKQVQTIIGYLENPGPFRSAMPNFQTHALMYGPPGTGKTLLAEAIAFATNCIFIQIKSSSFSPHELGNVLSKTFTYAKCFDRALIFIDEIDVMAGHDMNTARVLQQEMDGFGRHKSALVVVGATNHLRAIDSAMLSRFSERIEIPLPDLEQRALLFKYYLEKTLGDPRIEYDFIGRMETALPELARASNGLSGREIERNVIYHVVGNALTHNQSGSKCIITLQAFLTRIQSVCEQMRKEELADVEDQKSIHIEFKH